MKIISFKQPAALAKALQPVLYLLLPGFLFLSVAGSANYFNYVTILVLAVIGGMLGTLMMIPLRRSLIVKEHGVLPYPEGTACASVLKAGEKGGELAMTAILGCYCCR